MFFAYGWPRALAAFEGAGQEDVVYLHLDTDYCLIVSTGSVQIWTGGQHRIRLGHLAREETTLKNEGPNKCAYWCSSRRLLAVLVRAPGGKAAFSTCQHLVVDVETSSMDHDQAGQQQFEKHSA